jgi:hypothetical protein
MSVRDADVASRLRDLVNTNNLGEFRAILRENPSWAWLDVDNEPLVKTAIECRAGRRVEFVDIVIKAMEATSETRQISRSMEKMIMYLAAASATHGDITLFSVLMVARSRSLGMEPLTMGMLNNHPLPHAVAMSIAESGKVDLMMHFADNMTSNMTDSVIETMIRRASTLRDFSFEQNPDLYRHYGLDFDKTALLFETLLALRPIDPIMACCTDATFKGSLELVPALAWCTADVANAIVARLGSGDRSRLKQTLRLMRRAGVPTDLCSIVAYRVCCN